MPAAPVSTIGQAVGTGGRVRSLNVKRDLNLPADLAVMTVILLSDSESRGGIETHRHGGFWGGGVGTS